MKAILRGLAAFIAIVAIWVGPAAFVVWDSSNQLEQIYRAYKLEKDRGDYLFEAANSRGLLDICVDDRGVAGVWFKDDCKK